ncbi:MAG: hypothetical protein ACLP1X_09510 [Polyangiaceae bacterium]
MRREPILFSLLITISGCGGGGNAGAQGPRDGGATDTSVGQQVGSNNPDSGVNPADGGETASDSAAAGDASTTVVQTVSSWLGTNIAADLPRVDITYQLNPFDTAAAQLDANGYPVAGASGTSQTDIGFVLTTGTYNISYVGTGTLAVSGIGKLGGAWQSVNGEQRNTVQITGTPGSFGNFLTLTITNASGQTVQSIHLLYPGFEYDTTVTFLPQFIQLLAPFRAMRFMDWESTNNSKLANFADRPNSAHFGLSTFGEPYEHIAELVNETGKDCWINVPELATTDFIQQFAAFMAQNLDFSRIDAARHAAGFTTPFQLIVENSNETWNQGFSAYATFLAAANMNTTRYTGTYTGSYGPSWMTSSSDLMKVGQYEADRLVMIGNAFRTAFGANSGVVAPVLSGWALGPGYSDDGLQFIQANYGTPKQYVTYVAQAPYFDTPDDTSTGALDTLFAALDTNVTGMDATYQQFAMLGAQYGIGIVGYEGGQSLTGTTNQSFKHLAQHDERMYEAYKSYLALWKQDFGPSLFMHYSLAGDPGQPESVYQYGYWGSIIGVLEDTSTCELDLPTLMGNESIASVVHHCPKYRALAEAVPE